MMSSPHTPKRPNAQPQTALIVFAKCPVPGAVKTRLTPALSPEEAARLYEAFLRDALHQYLDLDVTVRLYLAPSGASVPAYLEELPIRIYEQDGPDLGARMLQAFRETQAAGIERAVIIGTDHPTLPTSFIRQAFDALDAPEAISIGPSEDGGYYLLGMNAVYPQLFTDMAYSHARVFGDTLDRVQATDARLTVLPPWYDVDTPDALRQLIADLGENSASAPRTRKAIAAMDLERRVTPE